jgi:hypothetical protein
MKVVDIQAFAVSLLVNDFRRKFHRPSRDEARGGRSCSSATTTLILPAEEYRRDRSPVACEGRGRWSARRAARHASQTLSVTVRPLGAVFCPRGAAVAGSGTLETADMDSSTKTRADWLLPAALITLCAIPLGAGAMRVTELAGGADITPENARFFAAPIPVVLHILGASLFIILGAFQFAPGFRRQRPHWHRRAGWLLVGCGLTVGLSGLWMTLFYPRAENDGVLLQGLQLLFGSAMVACMLLGVAAIRRRDFVQHGAWLTRGYAIGLGAGTQAVVHLPWILMLGQPGERGRAFLMGAGWVINVAVAEWSLRRRSARATRGSSQTGSETRLRIYLDSRSPPAGQPR